MKKFMKRWLGLYDLIPIHNDFDNHIRLLASEIEKLKSSLKRAEDEIDHRFRESQREWALMYSAQRGMAEYFGLQERRDVIPDFSYRPEQRHTIEVIAYSRKPKKNATSKVSKL